jgi:hypothetical protein
MVELGNHVNTILPFATEKLGGLAHACGQLVVELRQKQGPAKS